MPISYTDGSLPQIQQREFGSDIYAQSNYSNSFCWYSLICLKIIWNVQAFMHVLPKLYFLLFHFFCCISDALDGDVVYNSLVIDFLFLFHQHTLPPDNQSIKIFFNLEPRTLRVAASTTVLGHSNCSMHHLTQSGKNTQPMKSSLLSCQRRRN